MFSMHTALLLGAVCSCVVMMVEPRWYIVYNCHWHHPSTDKTSVLWLCTA